MTFISGDDDSCAWINDGGVVVSAALPLPAATDAGMSGWERGGTAPTG